MIGRWCTVAAVLCAMAAATRAAALPDSDTLVVTKDDLETTTPVTATEEITPEPALPIKLTEMSVRSEVTLRYAHTAVVAHVRNAGHHAQEAHFRVLLPDTAFISGFVMTIDGKKYKAYVKEKEEAKQIYQDAISHGFGAAHISAKARDSNHFTVAVNVEPSSSAIFNLTYEELLVRRNGVYNHAINLHPGALVPKLTVTVHIKESEKITQLRVPEIRTGNEIDATADDAQNSNAVIERGHDDREATITFTPNLEEQKRLMNVYAEKSKKSSTAVNQHSWSEPAQEEKIDGVLGQFVVQYDVDRSKDAEVLVSDGYFVHFFAPSSLPPLNKFVVFVLDTSGSMMDRKIEQLKSAMMAILSDLNPGDYFSIVEFDSSVKVHSLIEADQEPPKTHTYFYADEAPTTLPAEPVVRATPENIAKAKVIISRLSAYGGTNIYGALNMAVDLIRRRGTLAQGNTTTATTESPPVALPLAATTTVAPADHKKPQSNETAEQVKQLEPIIIFLTDGDPTVGVSNTNTIINHVTEKNYGNDKASIFSLAFGEDADRKFLRKLSLRSDGFMRHIYEGADAALQLRDFYRGVSSPLLAHVKFLYPADQVKADSLTKHKFRTFYAGSEVVVAGQLDASADELAPRVEAFCGVVDAPGLVPYEKLPKKPISTKNRGYFPLERLWAYLTIKQLLDDKDADVPDSQLDKENTFDKKALRLALKYEFVTSLTSLVVVKPNATNAVNAESVDKEGADTPFAPQGAAFGALPMYSYAMAPISTSLSYPSALHGLPGSPGKPSAVQDTAFLAEDEEDTEPDYASFQYVPTTALPMPTPDPLVPYGLQQFTWATSLVNGSADVLQFEANGTVKTLKLALNDVPKEDDDESCPLAVGGGSGVCVYLTRCDAAKIIDVEQYKASHCAVKGFAGVCCNFVKPIITSS